MRSLTLAVLALTFLFAPRSAQAQHEQAQPERLRTLSNDTAQLRADVGQSYRRLLALQNQMFGEDLGARVTIRQESAVDPFYRLEQITYALDGQTLLSRSGDEIVEPLEIHDGIVGPGDHTLTVVLRYVGEGHGVIGYLPGYRFVMRSAYQFTVPSSGRLDLRVRPYTRGPMVPYTERLAIEYEADEIERADLD